MHQAALDERVGRRVERLGVELVAGEPAVGADVELLQGGAAVGGHRASDASAAGLVRGPGAREAASAPRRAPIRASTRALSSSPPAPAGAVGRAPRAAIARASSVSEGASATGWTTSARSRPR